MSTINKRFALIKDDLQEIKRFIDKNQLTEKFQEPTRCADECYTHFNNIEIACDLSDNESDQWSVKGNGTITIYSSYGEIECDEYGDVTKKDLYGEEGCWLFDAVKFDLTEWDNWYEAKFKEKSPKPDSFDILEIAFWDSKGTFYPADKNFRDNHSYTKKSKKPTMDYSFYLFSKLRDVVFPSGIPYDIQHDLDMAEFKKYQDSKFNSSDAGEYECMVEYFESKKNGDKNNRVTIPSEQIKLVVKAMKFYIETSERLNKYPSELESEDLFDLKQLCAILHYPISVKINDAQKSTLSQLEYGIDFPKYL